MCRLQLNLRGMQFNQLLLRLIKLILGIGQRGFGGGLRSSQIIDLRLQRGHLGVGLHERVELRLQVGQLGVALVERGFHAGLRRIQRIQLRLQISQFSVFLLERRRCNRSAGSQDADLIHLAGERLLIVILRQIQQFNVGLGGLQLRFHLGLAHVQRVVVTCQCCKLRLHISQRSGVRLHQREALLLGAVQIEAARVQHVLQRVDARLQVGQLSSLCRQLRLQFCAAICCADRRRNQSCSGRRFNIHIGSRRLNHWRGHLQCAQFLLQRSDAFVGFFQLLFDAAFLDARCHCAGSSHCAKHRDTAAVILSQLCLSALIELVDLLVQPINFDLQSLIGRFCSIQFLQTRLGLALRAGLCLQLCIQIALGLCELGIQAGDGLILRLQLTFVVRWRHECLCGWRLGSFCFDGNRSRRVLRRRYFRRHNLGFHSKLHVQVIELLLQAGDLLILLLQRIGCLGRDAGECFKLGALALQLLLKIVALELQPFNFANDGIQRIAFIGVWHKAGGRGVQCVRRLAGRCIVGCHLASLHSRFGLAIHDFASSGHRRRRQTADQVVHFDASSPNARLQGI